LNFSYFFLSSSIYTIFEDNVISAVQLEHVFLLRGKTFICLIKRQILQG